MLANTRTHPRFHSELLSAYRVHSKRRTREQFCSEQWDPQTLSAPQAAGMGFECLWHFAWQFNSPCGFRPGDSDVIWAAVLDGKGSGTPPFKPKGASRVLYRLGRLSFPSGLTGL